MKELYEERRHIENLLNTRFNFFLVVFAAIIASFFTIKTLNQLSLVLITGALIETALSIVIARAQIKLKFFLNEIRKDLDHAEFHANNYANASKNPLINRSQNNIIGFYLPAFISGVLIISSFFSGILYNKFIIPDQKQTIEIMCVQNEDSIKTYIFEKNQKLDTIDKKIELNLKNDSSEKVNK